MIRTSKNFVQSFTTKNQNNDDKKVYIPNKYETCLKGDIAEIYISDNGNDDNDGFSVENAIKTLDKGFQIMKDYGWASVHFYFMTATNFYMNDYKNIAGCSIHFHTRADGVNIHIVNNSTAEKEDYDYTAFYGNHFNFGNTRTEKDITGSGDDYNIAQRMNVVFHSNVRGSYFEGCSVIFNACNIFQNRNSLASRNASNANEHYNYPLENGAKYTGFVNCSVDFDQCNIYDEIVLHESKAQILDCNFYVRNNVESFIYARNSKVLFRMGHTGETGQYVPRWNGASAYFLRFNSNIFGTSNFYSVRCLIFGLNTDFAFYDGLGILVAGASSGATEQLERAVILRNSTLTANTIVVNNSGHSAIEQINFYNPLSNSNPHSPYPTDYSNTLTCSTVNGVYRNSYTGDLGE